MNTSESFVRTLVGSQAPSPQWGTALTVAEEADLASRVAVSRALDGLDAAIKGDPAFGGMFIDQANGGVVDIALGPRADDNFEAMFRSSAPAGATLRFRRVQHSFAELIAARDRVRIDFLTSASITTINIDVRNNRVVIGLHPEASAEVRTSLEDAYLGLPIAFVEQAPFPTAACVSRQNCSPPLRGGIGLKGGDGACTSGFVMAAGTNIVLATAGHCASGSPGKIGENFYHPDPTFIGKSTKNVYTLPSTYADAMYIDISNSLKSNLIYLTSGSQRAITSSAGAGEGRVGDPVCGSGINTGFFCGTVLDDYLDATSSDGVKLFAQRRSSVDVRLGDSGGPMFYGYRAFGVISLVAGSSSGSNPTVWSEVIYSQIRDVEIQLNATVVKS